MSTPTVLITDMAILVGIFLLGFLAKMFPKKSGNRNRATGNPASTEGSLRASLGIRADRSSTQR
jgi:hypothetical protein